MSEMVAPIVRYADSHSGGDAYLLWKMSVERFDAPYRYGVVVSQNEKKVLVAAAISEGGAKKAQREFLDARQDQEISVAIEERGEEV